MPNGWWYMPPEPVPADPGWDDDLTWLDRDPMTAEEFEASLDRLCELDEPPGAEDYRYRDRVATILVRHLPPVIAAIQASGGYILEGPAPAPNGDRLIARHPDGAVFEYIETGDQPVHQPRS